MMFHDFIQLENKAVDIWQEVPSPGSVTQDTLDADLGEETQEPMLSVSAGTDLEKSCPLKSRDLRGFSWFTKYQSIHSEFSAWGFTERPE